MMGDFNIYFWNIDMTLGYQFSFGYLKQTKTDNSNCTYHD